MPIQALRPLQRDSDIQEFQRHTQNPESISSLVNQNTRPQPHVESPGPTRLSERQTATGT